MLTAEGQHLLCSLNMEYIPYKRVILAFRGLFLSEKRVVQDLKCCPFAVNKCPLKGHTIPYLLMNVWYLVITMLSAVQDCVTGNCKPPLMAESPVRSWKLACIADQNCYRR